MSEPVPRSSTTDDVPPGLITRMAALSGATPSDALTIVTRRVGFLIDLARHGYDDVTCVVPAANAPVADAPFLVIADSCSCELLRRLLRRDALSTTHAIVVRIGADTSTDAGSGRNLRQVMLDAGFRLLTQYPTRHGLLLAARRREATTLRHAA